MGWLFAQREQDGGANRPSPHAPSAAPTPPSAAPAHAGATHGVGEKMFVQVLVFRSVVMGVAVFVVVRHLSFLLGRGSVM
jgi:hypothetical protein